MAYNDIIKLIKKYLQKCSCGRYDIKFKYYDCSICEAGMNWSVNNNSIGATGPYSRDCSICKNNFLLHRSHSDWECNSCYIFNRDHCDICKHKLPENSPSWKSQCSSCYFEMERKLTFNECLIDSNSE
tara:strand:+ start:575 stop:958 length:384 start_codon:yes stop_codon:yes gene_type:complete